MNHRRVTRRRLLQVLGTAAATAPFGPVLFGQGRCRDGYGKPRCPLSEEVATSPIAPLFAPTGWRTVALEHVTFHVADYKKEAAFYAALMGWTLRSDDGTQAVMDVGRWGSVVFRQVDAPVKVVVQSFAFAIDPWNAKQVEQELRARGLTPVPEHDSKGFESFHVTDPDGFDLQIGNDKGLVRARQTPSTAKLSEPLPFEATGWKTVWLDHFSYGAADYKKSASFYANLLGWKETYDEGSQQELMIGDVGDIIIRGGNPKDLAFGRAASGRTTRIDHISLGIAPWDTDGVKAELEKRGLVATVDTSSAHPGPDGKMIPDDIHTAPFRSYHTRTPNGYNLQISWVTHDNRLALANAVKPKRR
jgi:catechol 2,3-dioxygenase-like lactoylglutathione lyase family enzyme